MTVRVRSIDAEPLTIPFRAAFRHASAERSATQSVLVIARSDDGTRGYGEGCPREYVTGEDPASVAAFVRAYRDEWMREIHSVETLRRWVQGHRAAIDAAPAAWSGVELALLDLIGKIEGRPIEALLGLPPLAGRFRYTAVIGDGTPQAFEAQLARYRAAGFRDFKIKLAGDASRDAPKVRALAAAGIAPSQVRADANNAWRDAATATRALRSLAFPFVAIEEPLCANDLAGMQAIAAALDTSIILDESAQRIAQLAPLAHDAARWIVNVRVSKMGGLLRSLEFVGAARQHGLRVVVGAHVGETSLLTRAALTVAQQARDILFAQEGAFGTHLLTHDVVEPALMFGAQGVLDADVGDVGRRAGLGLVLSGDR